MNGRQLVPTEVSEFLKHIVRSTWGLEVLMLLRNERQKMWSRAEISREIRGTLSVSRCEPDGCAKHVDSGRALAVLFYALIWETD
jgi:hypothetical protein